MEASTPVRFRVDLEGLPAAGLESVQERAARYLDDLVAALRIPGRAALAVGSEPEGDAGEDGTRLASPRATGYGGAIVPRGSEADIAVQLAEQAVYFSRHRLVTEAQAARLWRELMPSSGTEVVPAAFVRTLRAAVRYGLPVAELCDRLRDNGDPSPPADPGEPPEGRLDGVLEEALCGRPGPGVRFAFAPEQYDRCFDAATGAPRHLPGLDDTLEGMLETMCDGLFYELGLLFRASCGRDDSLEAPWFRVSCAGIPGPAIRGLEEGEFLVGDSVSRLRTLGIEARETVNPDNGNDCAVARGAEDEERCRQAGFTTWGPEGYAVLCARREVRRNAAAFVDRRLTDLYLLRLQDVYPALVAATRERFEPGLVTRVLRGLVDEGLSIRDLRGILEGLLSVQGVSTADHSRCIVFDPATEVRCPAPPGHGLADLAADDYVACARMTLRAQISHKYTRGASSLLVYLLDPAIEALLQDEVAAADPEQRRRIVEVVRAECGADTGWSSKPVVLTTVTVRKHFRRLIEEEFPELAVLAYQELSPEMNIQPIARISLE